MVLKPLSSVKGMKSLKAENVLLFVRFRKYLKRAKARAVHSSPSHWEGGMGLKIIYNENHQRTRHVLSTILRRSAGVQRDESNLPLGKRSWLQRRTNPNL